MSGVDLIAAERARQLAPKAAGGEGWDAQHDRGHGDELARAAASYAIPESHRVDKIGLGPLDMTFDIRKALWPWVSKWWKPTPRDRVRELTKAGALIAAAIDAELEKPT